MKYCLKISLVFFLLLAVFMTAHAQRTQTHFKTGKLVSTQYDEVAPFITGDKIIFISNRPVSGPVSGTDMQNRPFFKIIESTLTDKGKKTES